MLGIRFIILSHHPLFCLKLTWASKSQAQEPRHHLAALAETEGFKCLPFGQCPAKTSKA